MTSGIAQHPALVQGLLVAIASVLAVMPPDNGTMLVVPLLPVDAATTLGWVLPTRAALIAPGPYAGSFVVSGSRAALLKPAFLHATFLLTARFSGCGAAGRDSA